jgi:hypothetical protein
VPSQTNIPRRRRPAWMRRQTAAKPAAPPAAKPSGRDVRLVAVTAFVTVLATSAGAAAWGAVRGGVEQVQAAVSNNDPIKPFILLERDQQIQGETWIFPPAVSVTQQDQKVLTGAYNHIDEFRDWARSHGGADPAITVLKLVVEGQSRHKVRVVRMRARIDKREAPLTGMLLFAGTEQGQDNTQIGFNLDESDPVARTVNAGNPSNDPDYFGAPYFSSKQTKTLVQGEQEVFQVTARTLRSYVEWYIEVTLLVDDQEQTVEIRPANRNIRTSGLKIALGETGFAAYTALYVMSVNDLDRGFVRQDPRAYSRGD